MPTHEIKFATGRLPMGSCPINPAWILEGNPVARNKLIAESADKMASTLMWDCTAGRFNWHYGCDESICVVEGSVTVRDHFGITRTLVAGDSAFFPSGSSAEWTVDSYVRKIAIMRQPMPRLVLKAKRFYLQLKRLLGARVSNSRAPGISQTV
jgi:uncharacterized cupin superfamily protein